MITIHSRWRVKAAISLVLICTIHLATAQSVSKESFQRIVTLKGNQISFEEVLQQLSKQSKLYFIYNSSAIERKKSLSFDVHQRPMYEVLETLTESMHLSFRREGNYVVVKPIHEAGIISPRQNIQPQKTQPTKKITYSAAAMPLINRKDSYREMEFKLSIPGHLLKENLLNCKSSFTGIDSTFVTNYFPLKITNPRPRRYLYSSLGLMINEYSGGIEMQVGLPSLYAVLNAGLMREGYFRAGYGLGTAIPLKPRITLNPIYTYATLNRKEDYVIDQNINFVMKDGIKVKGQHHQVKFLIQMRPFKHIRLHVGPTFNFLKTSFDYQKGQTFYTDVVITNPTNGSIGYSVNSSQVRIIRSVYPTPSAYSTFKWWVGIEAGISYSIKFSDK
ncbi:DUF4974 domain-containing protein [Chryseolinea sp. H1M3-3]|uniref:DUF4974 domain-containing protein n=1 Tax=Chryseolinea sp. H1M3-3 TaxID=3034144 RepID=UPI0023ECD98A|nr:DUF4974 domain-containing protein [Chryseolinea sp. H1M3-3]